MTGGEHAGPWIGAGRDSALGAQHRPEFAASRLRALDDATTIPVALQPSHRSSWPALDGFHELLNSLQSLKPLFPQALDAATHECKVGTCRVETVTEAGGYPLDIGREPREAGQQRPCIFKAGYFA